MGAASTVEHHRSDALRDEDKMLLALGCVHENGAQQSRELFNFSCKIVSWKNSKTKNSNEAVPRPTLSRTSRGRLSSRKPGCRFTEVA